MHLVTYKSTRKVLLIQIKLIKRICIQVLTNLSLRDCVSPFFFTSFFILEKAFFPLHSRLIVYLNLLNCLESVFHLHWALCLYKISPLDSRSLLRVDTLINEHKSLARLSFFSYPTCHDIASLFSPFPHLIHINASMTIMK